MKKDKQLIVADAHVHIHDCYNIKNFFDSAWTNFFNESSRMGFNKSFDGILFLTESRNANWFFNFLQSSNELQNDNTQLGDLKIHKTKEDCSLKVMHEDGWALILIAGRQIVSKENLEVLALGVVDHFGEGDPVNEIVREIYKRGGIPVIPWGVGKWLGNRGSVVDETIQNAKDSYLFLGDNSGRPIFWRNPSHFKKAKAKNIQILPGSDPLPFADEYKKVGSFGFTLIGEIDQDYPMNYLKKRLLDSVAVINPFGILENPLRFFKNQFLMQLNKFN